MLEAVAHPGRTRNHWLGGPAALGIASARTLPSAREETQPVRNESGEVVAVFEGRLDNLDELRRQLQLPTVGRDAGLALRAYERWGAACAERLVGEFAFVVWDSRQQRMFAATDVTGTRSLFYVDSGALFAIASQPKAIFRLPGVKRTLNENKLLDYLVADHDRDDVTATIHREIRALAPGSALVADARGTSTWRYWYPEALAPHPFAHPQDFVEPFLQLLQTAIECRLATDERVATFLSGGLDSSTLVAIQKQRVSTSPKPIRTISLIGPDPMHCADARAIRAVIDSGDVDPIMISATEGRAYADAFVSLSPSLDDPFPLLAGYPMWVGLQRAREAGYRVLLEGMCADLLFYSPERTRQVMVEQRLLRRIPDVVRAHVRHGLDTHGLEVARRLLGSATPLPLRRLFRHVKPRSERTPTQEESGNHFARFRPHVAAAFNDAKRAAAEIPAPRDPLEAHARTFTGGLMSFAHALEGGMARDQDLEERSPYSDRRLIEFAIRMPAEVKLAAPWYKYLLRLSVQDMLPNQVVWRTDLGSHPGIHFFESLLAEIERTRPEMLDSRRLSRTLGEWLRPDAIKQLCDLRKQTSNSNVAYNLLSLAMLSHWLDTHFS